MNSSMSYLIIDLLMTAYQRWKIAFTWQEFLLPRSLFYKEDCTYSFDWLMGFMSWETIGC